MRFLLLFLFCIACFIHEARGQVLLDKVITKNNVGLRNYGELSLFDFNGKVKSISVKSYRLFTDSEPNVKFNISLIDYPEKSSTLYNYYFDNKGRLTKSEYKDLRPPEKKTKKSIDDSHIDTFEYKDGLLIRSVRTQLDSVVFDSKFEYTYDSQNRIVEIRMEGIDRTLAIEEIEYFEEGRKSSLFYFTDNTKKKTDELTYDVDGNLISHKYYNYASYVTTSLIEYYYSKDGVLECSIHRPRMSSFTQRVGRETFDLGTYSIYEYDKNGFLKETKGYKLEGETIDEKTNYWKGGLRFKRHYPRKMNGSYTVRKSTQKYIGKKKDREKYHILDHMNNIVVSYGSNRHSTSFRIYDITYYE